MPASPRLRPSFVLALALAAGACSRGDARAAENPPAATRAPAAAPAPRVDTASVGYATRHHRLTMAQMTKWVGVLGNLTARAKKDPSFSLRLGYPLEGNVAAESRAVAATPALRDALRGSGLTERDWVVVTMAYIGASMAAQTKDSTAALPPDVSPENVAFVRTHAKEIAALQKR